MSIGESTFNSGDIPVIQSIDFARVYIRCCLSSPMYHVPTHCWHPKMVLQHLAKIIGGLIGVTRHIEHRNVSNRGHLRAIGICKKKHVWQFIFHVFCHLEYAVVWWNPNEVCLLLIKGSTSLSHISWYWWCLRWSPFSLCPSVHSLTAYNFLLPTFQNLSLAANKLKTFALVFQQIWSL